MALGARIVTIVGGATQSNVRNGFGMMTLQRYLAVGIFIGVGCPCAAVAQGAKARIAVRTVNALALPHTGALPYSDTSQFTFFVAGDNRPAKAHEPQPATPGLIFAAAAATKPAFIVWTGDMIYGFDSANTKRMRKQYDEFFALAQQSGVPVFSAPGNHEMNVKIKHDDFRKEAGSAAMEAIYRENVGLAKDSAIYQSFRYGNSRFILVNTEEVAPPSSARSAGARVAGGKLNLDPGYVSPRQIGWIKQQLEASRTVAHIFLFMHHPIKPRKPTMALDSSSAAALMTLFSKYRNISYVFASHEHAYFNPQRGDVSAPPSRDDPANGGPSYLVSGGAGAPLEKGAFHNYLVVRVKGPHIDVEMVKLP